ETGATLRGDLLVALVADEEGVSIGTEALLASRSIGAMMIVEPDRLPRAIVQHQGFGWIDVFAANPDPMNGRTVFHTGTISGGTDYATYPGSAVLGIEIGTQPGEHLSDRVADIEAIFEEVRGLDPRFSGEVVVQLDREPFLAKGHEALYAAMDAASEEVLGKPLEPAGLNAWADSGLTQAAGVPTVMFGPLGGNFHAPDEWVSIPEVASAARIVEGTVRRFLK
ncbi:MAG: M20/M25/M40 family metallo-hydrolase, partial [Actinobacteria bacterium]